MRPILRADACAMPIEVGGHSLLAMRRSRSWTTSCCWWTCICWRCGPTTPSGTCPRPRQPSRQLARLPTPSTSPRASRHAAAYSFQAVPVTGLERHAVSGNSAAQSPQYVAASHHGFSMMTVCGVLKRDILGRCRQLSLPHTVTCSLGHVERQWSLHSPSIQAQKGHNQRVIWKLGVTGFEVTRD